jgi:hypothetical protein
MNDYISTIQTKVTNLLKAFPGSLARASKDRCSEIARLVGCWIFKDYPNIEISVLKGEFSNNMAHDILVVKYVDKIYVLDPTVWQIFPESKTIAVCTVNSITEAIVFVTNKYGGVWKVSELLKACSYEEEQKLLGIVC